MSKSPYNLVKFAEKRGLKEEALNEVLEESQFIIQLLIAYIREHHQDAVLLNKIAELKLEIANYAASQAYSNGQIKQTKNILQFLNTLTKEN